MRGGLGLAVAAFELDGAERDVRRRRDAPRRIGYAFWLGSSCLALNLDASQQFYGDSADEPESSRFWMLYAGFDGTVSARPRRDRPRQVRRPVARAKRHRRARPLRLTRSTASRSFGPRFETNRRHHSGPVRRPALSREAPRRPGRRPLIAHVVGARARARAAWTWSRSRPTTSGSPARRRRRAREAIMTGPARDRHRPGGRGGAAARAARRTWS